MITNPISLSKGDSRFKFLFSPATVSGNETLNGVPISDGDEVELGAGSINVLYAGAEGMFFTTESGFDLPYNAEREPVQTRAPSAHFYMYFVMPNENVEFHGG